MGGRVELQVRGLRTSALVGSNIEIFWRFWRAALHASKALTKLFPRAIRICVFCPVVLRTAHRNRCSLATREPQLRVAAHFVEGDQFVWLLTVNCGSVLPNRYAVFLPGATAVANFNNVRAGLAPPFAGAASKSARTGNEKKEAGKELNHFDL